MKKRAALLLLIIITVSLAVAQARPSADTASRAEVVQAARQALEAASRSLGRWMTFVIIAVLAAAALAAWRIWSLARQLARLEDLRAAWETRYAATADEVLRMKRKLAEAESKAGRLEDDVAALRPAAAEAATAQVAMVQSELVAVRERIDRAEARLEAIADHTVVSNQERIAAEELVRTASEARAAAESAAARAETIAQRAAAADSLRDGDEKLAQQQYPAAVLAYTRYLEALKSSGANDPELRFHALHNRALAHLRQQDYDAVLADAAALAALGSERARGAAGILSGVAQLGQGAVAPALKDFADAVERDAGARAVIQQDEDIAAWVKANPGKAGPVKRFIKALGRKPKEPRPRAARKSARRR